MTYLIDIFKESFSRATDWVKELQQQTTNHHIVMVLAGNKVDLASEKRAVSKKV